MQKNLFNYDLAEISISYSTKVKPPDRRKVTSSKDALDISRAIWPEGTMELKESFYVLYMNRANAVLGYTRLSEGGISGTVADPRLIFSTALKAMAVSIVLAHNHPPGNIQPSASDIQLTKNIVEGG